MARNGAADDMFAERFLRAMRSKPEREFVKAEANPLEELPSAYRILASPHAPSEAIRRIREMRERGEIP